MRLLLPLLLLLSLLLLTLACQRDLFTDESGATAPIPPASLDAVNSIQDLNEYMQQYMACEDSIGEEEWRSALPTDQEMKEMNGLLHHLLSLSSFDSCTETLLADCPTLAQSVRVTRVLNDYCMVHEPIPSVASLFPRFFGYVIVASPERARRNMHHSSPHLQSDGDTHAQAAYLFERSAARTLVMSGASRFAVVGSRAELQRVKAEKRARRKADLSPLSTCQPEFTVSDAAHNAHLMFHAANVAIKEWCDANAATDALFPQWHGMAETSCPKSVVFVSTGSKTPSIYEKLIPASKLVATVNRLGVELAINGSSPAGDSSCHLTATSNVFGRFINGVPSDKVCDTTASDQNVTGAFIHIEQKRTSRDAREFWGRVIDEAFPIGKKAGEGEEAETVGRDENNNAVLTSLTCLFTAVMMCHW